MIEEIVETEAESILKRQNPKLYDAVKTLVARKQSPRQIDTFIASRTRLRKGHPIRDLCYMTALSLSKRAK